MIIYALLSEKILFKINEINSKKELTIEEKFMLIKSKSIDIEVINYLRNRFTNLYIEVLSKYKSTLFNLMCQEKLEGWCWQTTESAIIFLNDNDYIERGNLYFTKDKIYYHFWICFNFNNIEYVLDPSLNFLCKKEDYYQIFNPNVMGKVYAKEVREELIRQVNLPKKEYNSNINRLFDSYMKEIMGESFNKYKESIKDEVVVHGPEDVNTPLYRNGAGYKVKIENGRVLKLRVHYYYTDC